MKVLIACEFSGIVRDAFTAEGHDVVSCDILPTERPGPHIQGDVSDHLNDGWDMMIAHPPCTYLSNPGLHYLKTKPERPGQAKQAFDFVKLLWGANIKKICLENPPGWLNNNWKRPSQIIQPYYFGDFELKTTCLWLKGLPKLNHTINNLFMDKSGVKPQPNGYCIRKSGKDAGKKYNYYFRQGKTGKQRSVTFQGIASAMADQWG